MANINDLFNQLVAANGKLDVLNGDINNGTAATNNVKVSVDKLDTDLKAGFTATINALTTIAQIETAAVNLLFHLTQQADTMICALEHISKNTCGILTQVTIQTGLETTIRNDTAGLLEIAETVNPAVSLERHRLAELRAQIEKCCPPPSVPPACSYEPCPSPRPIPLPNLPKPGGEQPPAGTVS